MEGNVTLLVAWWCAIGDGLWITVNTKNSTTMSKSSDYIQDIIITDFRLYIDVNLIEGERA